MEIGNEKEKMNLSNGEVNQPLTKQEEDDTAIHNLHDGEKQTLNENVQVKKNLTEYEEAKQRNPEDGESQVSPSDREEVKYALSEDEDPEHSPRMLWTNKKLVIALVIALIITVIVAAVVAFILQNYDPHKPEF
ncbi:uncharacterized protein LOC106177665 [Lingula anatina]|uniref:Uncharacterized protein LOC106177665 n=1 Tax=Lingula anatina TaxID=7574 RepID=A0A1S3JZZ7_LINAN|nr:uncharacterized protein LOC106177665 [Lingula anatina]|eukprot:XP_013415958.1 uncharacterized protein LOC106177665 [Lingula anatina]